MSTSSSLSTVLPLPQFSQNIGKDEQVVFARGPIAFSSRTTSSGANPFDFVVNLTSPFFYDPRKGSLAVDLWTFEGPSQGPLLDTAGIDDFGTTSVALSGNVSMDISGSFLDAPVLQIRYQAIPEPSPVWLGSCGSVFLIIVRAYARRDRAKS